MSREKLYRVFGGTKFSLNTNEIKTKPQAKEIAQRKKRIGYNVRVVQQANGRYSVYTNNPAHPKYMA